MKAVTQRRRVEAAAPRRRVVKAKRPRARRTVYQVDRIITPSGRVLPH